MKRAVSIIIAVFIFAMLLVSVSVSAEQTETGYIYFQIPTEGSVAWNNFKMVYCHMWSRAGGDVYGWQDKNERCEDLNNGYWRYDISGIDFMVKAGYNPLAAISMMNKILDRTWDIVSYHPSGDKRMIAAYNYIEKKYPKYLEGGYDTISYQRAAAFIMKKRAEKAEKQARKEKKKLEKKIKKDKKLKENIQKDSKDKDI